MITDFSSRFDSFYSARYDLRNYMECKGYREEGDRYYWQPQDPTDLEPVTPAYGPGAMRVGELDEFYQDNDEPTLGYVEFEEF